MSLIDKSQVKNLISDIESLTKELASNLENNKPYLAQAANLDKMIGTLVFCLGGLYVAENTKLSTKVSQVARTYIRDSRGRFAPKP